MNDSLPTATFATRAHERTSHRYSFIPTTDVISALAEDGWVAEHGSQKRVRDKSREGFQTHIINFYHPDVQPVNGQDRFSLMGRFSHDRSSSILLMAGINVFACSNGLIMSDHEVGRHRFIHRDIDLNEVVSAARKLVDAIPNLQNRVNRWKEITLSPAAQIELAQAGAVARWGSTRIPGSKAPAAEILLQARRFADRGPSLWHTFNRVQENLVKGTEYWARGGGRTNRWRNVQRRTRAVNGVDQNIDLNTTLWDLARRTEEGLPLLANTEDGTLVLA